MSFGSKDIPGNDAFCFLMPEEAHLHFSHCTFADFSSHLLFQDLIDCTNYHVPPRTYNMEFLCIIQPGLMLIGSIALKFYPY